MFDVVPLISKAVLTFHEFYMNNESCSLECISHWDDIEVLVLIVGKILSVFTFS